MNNQKLYKIDSKQQTRVWWIESHSDCYRTHSGVDGGKIVVSGWQYPEAKNVGRANETSIAEQVLAELEAKYVEKQYQGKYHANKKHTSKGAQYIECMLEE